ncbi:HLA class II histocompatibility antigen, DRB1-16 beta chain-like, partial [Neopelma chrysocephalum]|uniref:HLA class II histocompatibility antigen, DRB1-16 beta chain-like n=1 Tax=Neopelma chrysocephalum TaxID=114329 RepID=UPI000FCD2873
QSERSQNPPKRRRPAGFGVSAAVRRWAWSVCGELGPCWRCWWCWEPPPAAGEELSGVFQWMGKQECHFINGTEQVRFVERHIYNREQLLHFDSHVGVYVADTPFGEIQARYWNSHREYLKYKRGQVDTYCRYNYKLGAPFSVERRVPPSVSISLVPSSSQPGPGRLLC